MKRKSEATYGNHIGIAFAGRLLLGDLRLGGVVDDSPIVWRGPERLSEPRSA